MAEQVGYKLLGANGGEVASWGGTWGQCPALPNPIVLPNGDHVHGATTETELPDGYQLVAWMMDHPPALPYLVDQERDRRIEMGFTFADAVFQARPDDLANINGAVSAALIAVSLGAQPGDLRWADPDADFAWLSIDNLPVPMDAPTVLAFGQAALTHKSRLIWKGRAIKDAILAGTFEGDITADASWGF